MLVAVVMHRRAAVCAMGALAVVVADAGCSNIDGYHPAVPRVVTQDALVVRLDALHEEVSRNVHRLSVDLLLESPEPIRITTVRLMPRTSGSCEGGIEASAMSDGRGSTWSRWVRTPLVVEGERSLRVAFEGHEALERVATE